MYLCVDSKETLMNKGIFRRYIPDNVKKTPSSSQLDLTSPFFTNYLTKIYLL
jgi:hypothetical protein